MGEVPLQLRGEIALAARAVRRVFPILVLEDGGEEAAKYDLIVGMAECFAEGGTGSIGAAQRLLISFTPTVNSTAPICLGRAAASAFVVERVRRRDDQFDAAVVHAHEALEAVHVRLHNYGGADLAMSALHQDWHLLSLTHELEAKSELVSPEGPLLAHHIAPALLGTAIALSEDGPLGPLWPKFDAPSWFLEGTKHWYDYLDVPEIKAIPGPSYWEHRADWIDIVCWHVPAHDEQHLERAIAELGRATDDRQRETRPTFVVFAPGLNEVQSRDLARLGAVVFTALPEPAPIDDQQLCAVLARRLRGSLASWSRTDDGWLPRNPRVLWREGLTALEPPPQPRQVQLDAAAVFANQTQLATSRTRAEELDFLNALAANEWCRAEY